VAATANAVAIEMDGGGPMYHEGIGVVIVPGDGEGERIVDRCSKTLNCRRLDNALPVFLYRFANGSYEFLEQVDRCLHGP
jgi:hypothetical protein